MHITEEVHDTAIAEPRRRSASGTPPPISGVRAAHRMALVVGASSGIGAALVRALASEGYRVAAVARRRELLTELESECAELARESGGMVRVYEHDVRRTAEIPALFETIARDLGGLYLVVYAAGVMPPILKTEYDTAKDLDQIAINLGGCVAWLNRTANYFAAQRQGTIVGISSIAGDRGRKGNPVYCTTKAAMNTYLEALRNRLSEAGCHVCTIKPGYVDTAMVKGVEKLFWLISADEAARSILGAARNRINVRYVPLRWGLVGAVLKCLPSLLFRKLNI